MGTRERQQAAHVALAAAVARLGSLPVPQLAAEVMARLGPDGPDAVSRPLTAPELVEGFAEGALLAGLPAGDNEVRRQLVLLVLEGLQALEHASLICFQYNSHGIGHLSYMLTRRGQAALWHGTVEASVRASEPRESAP
jgi:hypothetical protein